MSFNKWFVEQVVDMANDYEDRIKSLEHDVEQLKLVIQNLYTHTDVNVHCDNDIDVTVHLNIDTGDATPYDLTVSDVFSETKVCDKLKHLIDKEDYDCKICLLESDSGSDNE